MKTRFHSLICPDCQTRFDPLAERCPTCGKENEDQGAKAFRHHLILSWPKQLCAFALGWAGFQVIASLIQVIFEFAFVGSHPEAGKDELLAYASSVAFQAPVNFISYGILFGAMACLLWSGWKGLLSSFKHYQAAIWGVGGFFVVLSANAAYSGVLEIILKALGIEFQINENETVLRGIIAAYPALSLLIFGILGPWCEEMTYRVGLFGFLSRVHKAVGYVVSILIFALIHFGWQAIGSEAIWAELYNIPSYFIAGFVLAFVYDKGGFAASFTAHSLNNLLSVMVSMTALGAK